MNIKLLVNSKSKKSTKQTIYRSCYRVQSAMQSMACTFRRFLKHLVLFCVGVYREIFCEKGIVSTIIPKKKTMVQVFVGLLT